MVWPVTGIATLWWAMRSGQRGALGFALVLQLVAGAVSVGSHTPFLGGIYTPPNAGAFMHSGFWNPLLIGIAAFVAAWLLQRREASRASQALGWAALSWSAAWWAFAWSAELDRLLP